MTQNEHSRTSVQTKTKNGRRIIESVIPSGRTPTAKCRFCGQPFPEEEQLLLHRGIEHYDHLDETEREAYAEVYWGEQDEIRRFRLKALAMIVVLYFGLLMVYIVFTS